MKGRGIENFKKADTKKKGYADWWLHEIDSEAYNSYSNIKTKTDSVMTQEWKAEDARLYCSFDSGKVMDGTEKEARFQRMDGEISDRKSAAGCSRR